MIITGILHFFPILTEPDNPDAIPMLIFGIAYLSIGILLFLNKNIAQILGLVIPAIGLAIGLVKIGIKNWDLMLSAMFIIDAIVIVCCIILLLNRNKAKTATS